MKALKGVVMGLAKQSEAKANETPKTARRVAKTEIETNNASRSGIFLFSVAMAVIGYLAVFVPTLPIISPITIIASAAAGLLLATSVRVAPQWERVAILRFGKFNRVAGPGLYCTIPFVEYGAIHVDQRIATASFSAEAALTADLVPVDVDAILFWMVWDVEKACFEVKDYPKAVLRSAQTAMRDVIGQLNLADISTRRKQIDRELEEMLASKCEHWGVTVLSVEIRDIMVPQGLQDALSKEAQAEREKNARVILAEVEKDISEMFVEAADVYEKNPKALQLRAMNLAYEGVKDGKGVLLTPSALADGFDMGRLFKKE